MRDTRSSCGKESRALTALAIFSVIGWRICMPEVSYILHAFVSVSEKKSSVGLSKAELVVENKITNNIQV